MDKAKFKEKTMMAFEEALDTFLTAKHIGEIISTKIHYDGVRFKYKNPIQGNVKCSGRISIKMFN